MLGLPPSVRIYFAAEPVDMRKGIDGLRAHVEGTFRKDPYEGHLFVFVGKRRERSTFYIRTRQDQDRVSVAPALRQARSGIAAGPS